MMLAITFSFVMLGFGGAGGLINMSYQLDSTIHNTQWVTGHFHLIFAGAVVIMYFVIAYDLWPQITGRPITDMRLIRIQLWLWFIGIMVLTIPWHLVGVMGMPRRMAYFDYTNGEISSQGLPVIVSVIGGVICLLAGLLFIFILLRAHRSRAEVVEDYTFSVPIHRTENVPSALNGFRLWLVLMIGLTLFNYGYPIASLIVRPDTAVPGIPIGRGR
jgi:cytochrome c oxidase subunit 1